MLPWVCSPPTRPGVPTGCTGPRGPRIVCRAPSTLGLAAPLLCPPHQPLRKNGQLEPLRHGGATAASCPMRLHPMLTESCVLGPAPRPPRPYPVNASQFPQHSWPLVSQPHTVCSLAENALPAPSLLPAPPYPSDLSVDITPFIQQRFTEFLLPAARRAGH